MHSLVKMSQLMPAKIEVNKETIFIIFYPKTSEKND